MISLIQQGNGAYSLFQKNPQKRISFQLFLALLESLKIKYRYVFDPVLYGQAQPAYIFFADEQSLSASINEFLNRFECVSA